MKLTDLTEVPEEKPAVTLVPEGTYTVVITDAEEGTSSVKGTPQIALSMEIADGEYKGRGVWDHVYITDAAMWRMKQFLMACRFQLPEGPFDLNTAELINRRIEVDLYHDEYNDKTRVKVEAFRPATGPLMVEAKPEDDIPF